MCLCVCVEMDEKRARRFPGRCVKKKSAGTGGAEIAVVNFAPVQVINVHHTASASVQRLSSSFLPSFLPFFLSFAPRSLDTITPPLRPYSSNLNVRSSFTRLETYSSPKVSSFSR